MSTSKQTKKRLEYLRGELRAERISYGELFELQSLAKYIDSGDVELLEAAGVEEFEPTPKELWNKACDHDGIERTSKFVIFFDNNPWAAKYNEAMGAFMERMEKPVIREGAR